MRRNPCNGYFALRFAVLERDLFTCRYCGQKAPDTKLEVDHIIPVVDGGEDTMDNLITSCYACNRGRGSLSIQVKRRGSTQSRVARVVPPSRKDLLLALLSKTPIGLKPNDISSQLNITENNAHQIVHRLTKQGVIYKNKEGCYSLCKIQP